MYKISQQKIKPQKQMNSNNTNQHPKPVSLSQSPPFPTPYHQPNNSSNNQKQSIGKVITDFIEVRAIRLHFRQGQSHEYAELLGIMGFIKFLYRVYKVLCYFFLYIA